MDSYKTVIVNLNIFKVEKCQIECEYACAINTFDVDISTVMYPKQYYAETSLMKKEQVISKYPMGNMTYSDLRSKTLRIEIFYGESEYEQIIELEYISLWSFIAGLGGIFGESV